MHIAPEGYRIIALAALIALLLLGWGHYLGGWARYALYAMALGGVSFALYFFRDPPRHPPQDPKAILAPADGRVIRIERFQEPEFLGGTALRVSIFMSPFDVHVNRIPYSGRIAYVRYVPGTYLVAWEDKASERNERALIGVENGSVRVLFVQIAGFLARRIVYHVRPGDSVRAGDRYGMIKFGSRLDVYMPPEVALRVRVGDRTRAGETILGVLP
ncbi:MAG: phosphatidylserine decarboxylase family protein [Bacteroidota bacterium]|nr:phosphatidylserine decarboxylase family protein [Rhodothermia bacterium]MCS7154488.1 phosphatidylserine decarboxylase family protein [Bacteroidota bacterium]MDW8136860.1 phosphatidylserine decarboxylase family protein [Bacteroidota bacterium]MDW8285270.1 phosphatidylserine decarboxylase family protein [Bacteroidota bacterium]